MHAFTSLAHQFTIKKEEINYFDRWSIEIIETWSRIDSSLKIFPKLHMLTHYGQLTKKFGPPVLFSTLKYERKHVYFKNWSNVMANFQNPPVSFAVRHQLSLAVNYVADQYSFFDFFETAQPSFDIFSTLVHSLPDSQKLLAAEYPFNLSPVSIFQIANRRQKFWLRPVSFRKTIDNSIFACGQVFEQQTTTENESIISKLQMKYCNPKCRHRCKLSCKCSWKYIKIVNLGHRVDFLFVFNEYFYLIKGLI